ncbi:MAG: hypothetical protein ACYS0D_01100 [Planctomycetota bacterium]|jgi:hypothetical protein
MNDERVNLLISRAVGGDATTVEWDELTTQADERPQLWRRLGETLRDQTGFTRALEAAAAVAHEVEPEWDASPASGITSIAHSRSLRHWSGWAVAAALVLAWVMSVTGPAPAPEQAQLAELLPTATAADLFDAYLARGRADDTVIGEVPEKIVVDSRTAPTGEGYELLYLRQILERAVVPDLYQVEGADEMGRPVLVRFERPRGGSM